MAVQTAQEGVINFTADGDTYNALGSKQIVVVVVHDPGDGTCGILQGGASGKQLFGYNVPASTGTVPGSYCFQLHGVSGTSGGLYFASTGGCLADVYIR